MIKVLNVLTSIYGKEKYIKSLKSVCNVFTFAMIYLQNDYI